MHVTGYAFAEEQLSPCDVFTVPELSDGMFFWSQETFFTDLARVAINKAELVGFRFMPLPMPTKHNRPFSETDGVT